MHVYLSFMKKIAILLPFVFLLLALLTGCQKNPSLESNSSSTVDSPNQSGSSLPSQPIGPSQAAEPAALPMITADTGPWTKGISSVKDAAHLGGATRIFAGNEVRLQFSTHFLTPVRVEVNGTWDSN